MMGHAPFLGQVPLKGAAWRPAPMRPNQPTVIPGQSGPSPTLGQNEGPDVGTIIVAVVVGGVIVGLAAYFTGWLTEK